MFACCFEGQRKVAVNSDVVSSKIIIIINFYLYFLIFFFSVSLHKDEAVRIDITEVDARS